jgi:outer membrane protein OmpA-like peptidoglycan-associated protein
MLSACHSGLITDYAYVTPNFVLESTMTLYFASNSAVISEKDREQLDKAVSAFCLSIVQDLRIEGHADAAGPSDYNLRLSRRRAETIHAALVRQGVPAANMEIRVYGEERPAVVSSPEAGEKLNRRVTFEWTPHPSLHPFAQSKYTGRCGGLKPD